jgi:hypothetical protein
MQHISGRYSLDNIVTIHPERFVVEDSEPTLFLANHRKELDALAIFAAIRRARNNDRVIRPSIRDDIYLDEGLNTYERIQRFAQFCAGKLVGVFTITQPGTRTGRRRNTVYKYSRELSHGYDIIVFPTGQKTKDGRVDSLEEHLRNQELKAEHIDALADLVNCNGSTLHVQYVHHTYDPITKKTIITPGERFEAQERQIYGFAKELSHCTAVTPLQAYAVFKKMYGKAEVTDGFPRLLEMISALGIPVFSPFEHEETTRQVFAFLERNPVDLEWQLNEVAHVFRPQKRGEKS